jgi:hypothetical protein
MATKTQDDRRTRGATRTHETTTFDPTLGHDVTKTFDEFQELASARRPYGDPDAVANRMRAIFQRSTAGPGMFR